MKIAFFIYGELNKITGGYIYDRQLVDFLEQSNHEIDVISLPDTSYWKSISQNFQNVFYERLTTHQYDIILQDELCHPSLFWRNNSIRSELQTPVITIVHALKTGLHKNAFTRSLIKLIESHYLQSVDGLIYISEYTRNQSRELTTIERPGIIAHPAGDRLSGQPSLDEIHKKIPRDGILNLLYIGAITENKQLHHILETLSRFRDETFQLSIAGKFTCSMRYEKTVHQLAAQVRNMHSINFLGQINNKTALANLYKTHHLLILPSQSEGLPLVVLEAASFGVPSITTERSAANEFIQDGKNGVLIKPDDQSELGHTLSYLHTNRELLSEMSLNVYRRFQEHPTWNETGKKIEKFLFSFRESHR